MADFNKAYRITSSWEGKWSRKPERGSEKEEAAYGEWWGTNYGLTGSYMRDFAGWNRTQKSQFQNMTIAQAGAVWKKTRWAWMQGDKINDQEIANLIFDWGVRRWNNFIKGLAAVLNVNVTEITRKVKMIDVGGTPLSKTDGFSILNDYAIQLINTNPNPQLLHAQLKAKRAEIDVVKNEAKSIQARYQSFSYMGTDAKDVLLANAESKKKGLVIQTNNKNTDGGSNFGLLEIGFGLVLGKVFKIW